jgi:hypothetical protein
MTGPIIIDPRKVTPGEVLSSIFGKTRGGDPSIQTKAMEMMEQLGGMENIKREMVDKLAKGVSDLGKNFCMGDVSIAIEAQIQTAATNAILAGWDRKKFDLQVSGKWLRAERGMAESIERQKREVIKAQREARDMATVVLERAERISALVPADEDLQKDVAQAKLQLQRIETEITRTNEAMVEIEKAAAAEKEAENAKSAGHAEGDAGTSRIVT